MDQIEVAHPLAEFGIDQTVKFVRGGFERLGEEGEPGGEDRHLAGFGMAEPAVDADDVTQIEAVDDGPDLRPHLLLAEHDLNPPAAVGQAEKNQTASRAQEHDPPRHAHLWPVIGGGLARRGRDRLPLLTHLDDRKRAIKPAPPGIDAHCLQAGELVAPGFFQAGRGSLGAGWIGGASGGGGGGTSVLGIRVWGVCHACRSGGSGAPANHREG